MNELWLDVADGSEAQVASTLSQPPFAVLEKQLPLGARGGRAARSARTRDAPGPRRRGPRGARPRGRWGLVLAVRADLRDDRGELVDLEAQGATPTFFAAS